MDPELDIGETSTCTTCQFSEDFSNYWTAILYFQARNGSYYRVPQIPNAGFEKAKAGMTVYYMQDALQTYQQTSKVTAFKKGFRMLTGDPTLTTAAEAKRFRQLTFTCLETLGTRFPETQDFPSTPCKAGIMANLRFPTCWDGRNLDSASHRSHVAYPEKGTFETQGPCPDSHPVRLPQLMYETIWDTTKFNDPNEWPEDRPHPFVWSFGDKTGYGTHGDYVFGWKGDSLQRAMDSPCFVNCPTLKTQGFDEMNSCSIERTFDEELTGCRYSNPPSSLRDY